MSKKADTEAAGRAAANLLFDLAGAWVIMLAIGVLHSKAHVIPTFGFWEVLVVRAGIRHLVFKGVGHEQTDRGV